PGGLADHVSPLSARRPRSPILHGARAAGRAPSVKRVADPEPAPVAAADVDRHRQVEHDLAGVAAVHLQAVAVGMGANTAADAVVEDALGAVADQVARRIAGERLAE